MSQATVGRWGKSLAVRIPGEIADAAGLIEGERVRIETQDAAIVIRRAPARFTLKSCFAAKPLRSGGRFMPMPMIGGRTLAEKLFRNEGARLYPGSRRSDLD